MCSETGGGTGDGVNCEDSDGINYYEKGECTDEYYKEGVRDYCENGNILHEYYCKEGEQSECVKKRHECEHGCENGACRRERVENKETLQEVVHYVNSYIAGTCGCTKIDVIKKILSWYKTLQ